MNKMIISEDDLKVLKKNSEVLRTLHLIETLSTHGSDIKALEKGEKWSGSTRRKVSLPDIIEDHKQNLKGVEIMRKSYEKANMALLRIESVLRKYKKCPQCKGEQGSWSPKPPATFSRSTWSDCAFCDGHGYTLKPTL